METPRGVMCVLLVVLLGAETARARRRDRALAGAQERSATRYEGGGPWGNHGFPHARGWRRREESCVSFRCCFLERKPAARGGETVLSPERKSDPPRATKEGARGGTMGSPTLEDGNAEWTHWGSSVGTTRLRKRPTKMASSTLTM